MRRLRRPRRRASRARGSSSPRRLSRRRASADASVASFGRSTRLVALSRIASNVARTRERWWTPGGPVDRRQAPRTRPRLRLRLTANQRRVRRRSSNFRRRKTSHLPHVNIGLTTRFRFAASIAPTSRGQRSDGSCTRQGGRVLLARAAETAGGPASNLASAIASRSADHSRQRRHADQRSRRGPGLRRARARDR